jgi:hypothetical protein
VAFAVLDRTSPQVVIGDQLVERQVDEHTSMTRHAALNVIEEYLTGRLRDPAVNPQSSTVNPQSKGTDAPAAQPRT